MDFQKYQKYYTDEIESTSREIINLVNEYETKSD